MKTAWICQEKITRLNSRQENDSMMEDAFKRFSEKEKIFCAKQMNSFNEDVAEDHFILQINNSSAQRTNTKTTAGTSSMADAGTKISSKRPASDLTKSLELLPDTCRNSNLATTKRAKDPSTNPSIISSSAFKISGSIPSHSEGATVSLSSLDMKPEGIVKLNGPTLSGIMEGDDFEGDDVGEDDNLFKSKLVQRTCIPQLAVLNSSDSNGELNINTY